MYCLCSCIVISLVMINCSKSNRETYDKKGAPIKIVNSGRSLKDDRRRGLPIRTLSDELFRNALNDRTRKTKTLPVGGNKDKKCAKGRINYRNGKIGFNYKKMMTGKQTKINNINISTSTIKEDKNYVCLAKLRPVKQILEETSE
uniref:Uncharacterized protein n=1 Tax=Parastrongyloides trichosuri TaxID=131310 RepID=A0A0N5A6L4_PARTI